MDDKQGERKNVETLEQKTARNCRVQARYDELMREGKRGHYETMFRVVREELERERERRASRVRGRDSQGLTPIDTTTGEN